MYVCAVQLSKLILRAENVHQVIGHGNCLDWYEMWRNDGFLAKIRKNRLRREPLFGRKKVPRLFHFTAENRLS